MDVSPPQRFTLHALCHSPYQVVGSNPTFCSFSFFLAGARFLEVTPQKLQLLDPLPRQKCQLLGIPSTRSSSFWASPASKVPTSESPSAEFLQKLHLLDGPRSSASRRPSSR